MRIVVFDFDKTLTFQDSMIQLFMLRMMSWRIVYLPFFILMILLVKMGFVSVKYFKEKCIYYLCPKNVDRMVDMFEKFSPRIKLSPIIQYLEKEIVTGGKIIILSASPVYYLRKIFPSLKILGMTVNADSNGNFISIDKHPYGKDKLLALAREGITHIDVLYYDSKSDEVLLPICDEAYKVFNGRVIRKTV